MNPYPPKRFSWWKSIKKGIQTAGGGAAILATVTAFVETPEGASALAAVLPAGIPAVTLLAVLRAAANIWKNRDMPGAPMPRR